MRNPHAEHLFPLKTRRTAVIAIGILLLVIVGTVLPSAHAQALGPSGQATVKLVAGETLYVSTDRPAIQKVTLLGNLSTASYPRDLSYPTDGFRLTALEAGKYELVFLFDNTSPYTITLSSLGEGSRSTEIASYYVSRGEFSLSLAVEFLTRTTKFASNQSLIEAFLDWLDQFAEKFPLWVKALYMILGAQFVIVGAAWITYEDRKRRREHMLSRFDRGNIAYLWSDVAYKFLAATFVILAVVMGGQYILLQVLRFMFLVQLELLSLWDLFVIGFAGGMALLAYVLRTFLGRVLDLKPLEDE